RPSSPGRPQLHLLHSSHLPRPPSPTLFPYTTLFRSSFWIGLILLCAFGFAIPIFPLNGYSDPTWTAQHFPSLARGSAAPSTSDRSEEHTSELQSRGHLVCRLLLEKKNTLHSSGCWRY